MLHDIFFALIGFTGDIITISENHPTCPYHPTYTIVPGYPAVSDSEKEQINQIVSLGWYYKQFQLYISQYDMTWSNASPSKLSIYKMALAAALQDLLQEYNEDISKLEDLINREIEILQKENSSFSSSSASRSSPADDLSSSPVIPYTTFLIQLKNYELVFPYLYKLLQIVEGEDSTKPKKEREKQKEEDRGESGGLYGCQILDFFSKCMIGNPVIQDVVNRYATFSFSFFLLSSLGWR
jgi:hypothetical protein